MEKTRVAEGGVRYILVCLLFVLLLPSSAAASEITIRPFLIDETLSARDISQKIISLKSDYTDRKSILYATVNEISVDEKGEIKEFVSPVMTDRTNTITSWIEITRGRIELMPGESKEIPLTVRVHPRAEPGEYHTFIGFVEASNRPKAEAIAMAGEARGVILKIVVADERIDSMRVASFLVDRFIATDDQRTVDVLVENTGDLPTAPDGEIIFYDSRGTEVASVPVNESGVIVAPGETATLKSSVPMTGALGRFKANLSLKYGENQKASLYDTTYFYLIPIHLMIGVLVGVLLVSIMITLLFKRAFFQHDGHDDYNEVTMFVRDGHDPQPKDHDINLKNNG